MDEIQNSWNAKQSPNHSLDAIDYFKSLSKSLGNGALKTGTRVEEHHNKRIPGRIPVTTNGRNGQPGRYNFPLLFPLLFQLLFQWLFQWLEMKDRSDIISIDSHWVLKLQAENRFNGFSAFMAAERASRFQASSAVAPLTAVWNHFWPKQRHQSPVPADSP